MKVNKENTEKHKELRAKFYKETGIYAILDNDSYTYWLENIIILKNSHFSCYLEDSEQGKRCKNQCSDCSEYKGELG